MSANTNNAKKMMNKGVNALKGANKIVLGLVGLFVFLVVGMIIYWIYKAYMAARQGDSQNPILVSGAIDASDSDNAKSWELPETSSSNSPNMAFTISFWMYIADWNYRLGEPKAILIKGNPNGTDSAPGIYLAPNKNNLIVKTASMSANQKLPACNVSNIPIQKWVHVGYVLDNRTIDIYINGKLERSCVLTAVPALNNGNLYLIPSNTGSGLNGFLGQISSLRYFSDALRPVDIANLYNEGPKATENEPSSDSSSNGNGDGGSCVYNPDDVATALAASEANSAALLALQASEGSCPDPSGLPFTINYEGTKPVVTEGFQHYARRY